MVHNIKKLQLQNSYNIIIVNLFKKYLLWEVKFHEKQNCKYIYYHAINHRNNTSDPIN